MLKSLNNIKSTKFWVAHRWQVVGKRVLDHSIVPEDVKMFNSTTETQTKNTASLYNT